MKLFHKQSNAHKRFNNIDKLKVGDDLVEDDRIINAHILDSCMKSNLFTEPVALETNIGRLRNEEIVGGRKEMGGKSFYKGGTGSGG